MTAHQAWTFEPFEAEAREVVDIYDPNLARIVATFYDTDDAAQYLKWRNKKQAKLKAERKFSRFIDYDGRY